MLDDHSYWKQFFSHQTTKFREVSFNIRQFEYEMFSVIITAPSLHHRMMSHMTELGKARAGRRFCGASRDVEIHYSGSAAVFGSTNLECR